ncbi:MAG: NB-ARC domain-containing protein [Saprospiraceae bacterium]
MAAIQPFLNHIRELIAHDRLDEALQKLRTFLENSPLLDEAIQQSGRWAAIRKQVRLGTVGHEDAAVTENQIRQGLIEFVNEIEEQGQNPRFREEVARAAIPHALTAPPFLSEVFIGREDDLQTVHDHLFSGDNLLMLINGEGGVGKTTLAARYYHRYQNEYEHVAWVLSEKSIANALLNLKEPLGLFFEPDWQIPQKLEVLFSTLFNLRRPCLLVIDNANELEDLEANYLYLRRCSNFHLLLTSRIQQFERAQTYRIEGLPEPEVLQLFREYYPKLQSGEAEIVKEIRRAVGANTLVLELLAKNLAVLNRLRPRYTLDDLLADLRGKGLLQLAQTAEVRTGYQSREGQLRRANPHDIIAAMYDLGELPREEVALLSVFSVLPAEGLPFEILESLLPDTPELEDRLFSLAQKGWIEYNEGEVRFKCSPVVQEVTRVKNEQLEEDCAGLVKKLIAGLDSEVAYAENYRHSAPLARLAEAVIQSAPWQNDDLGDLCHNLGGFHTDTGDLTKAMDAYQKMEGVQSALYSNNPENSNLKNGLAISYLKLGKTHGALGNLEKAFSYYEGFNKLEKELYDSYPQNVSFKNGLAISFQFLGNTHSELDNRGKALSYYEDFNKLEKELCDLDPQNVEYKNNLAISYEKLGETHSELDNLEKALSYYEDFNKLEKELYDLDPQNVEYKNNLAISYEKLGEMHRKLGNLDKALSYYEGFNKLEKELYDSYPQNVSFKNLLAISFQFLGNTHSKLDNLEKALSYYEDFNKLEKELYDSYPQNVEYKNNLAISYAQLGRFYWDKKEDKAKARSYFEQCYTLRKELSEAYPAYAEFKKNYEWAQKVLEGLK